MGWLLGLGDAERVTRIGWNLSWFWFIRGFLAEGRQWMERTLASGATLSPACRAKALTVIGLLAWAQGAYDRTVAAVAESIRLASEVGDRATLAVALHAQAFTAITRGDHAQAAASAEEGSRLYRALGDKSGAGMALLAAAHAAGAEDPTRAVRLLDESETLARESGAPFGLASALNARAMFLQLGGEDARTVGLLRESLALSRDLGDTYTIGYGLIGLAGALVALKQWEQSARLYGAAEALREVTRTPIQYAGSRTLYEQRVTALREQLGAKTFDAAWSEGRTMPLEDALTKALAKNSGPRIS